MALLLLGEGKVMASRWFKPRRLMGRNPPSILGMVCLLAWLVPAESWAQGSLWNDLKAMAEQVVRDKIKSVPESVTNSPPSQPSTPQPVATSVDDAPLQPTNPALEISRGGGNDNACPVQSAARTMKIPNPSCEQLWAYQVFRTESMGFMLSMGKIMEAGIERKLNNQTIASNLIEAVSVFSASKDLIHDINKSLNTASTVSPRVAEKLTKAAQDSLMAWNLEMPGLLALVVETGNPALTENNAYIFGKEAWNFMADSVAVYMNPAAAPEVLSKKLAQLVVDEWALVTTEDLRVKFDSQLLAQRYLLAYYQYGQNTGVLNRSLGLSTNASTKDVLTKLARDQLGFKAGLMQIPIHWPIDMSRDVDLVYTWDWVKKLDNALVQPRAKFCMEAPQYCGVQLPTLGQVATPIFGTDAGQIAENVTSGLSGVEAAQALGSTTDYDRRDAIRRMVEHNSIRSPLSAREAALIVKGATGAARAQCIAALAKLIKHNLSGEEGATVLGSAREITEYDRRDAIRALAKEERFGANGADAGLFLVGATGAARAQSIASFAKSLKPHLSGQEAATILGGSDVLQEYDRRDAIRALAESRRLRQGMLGDELAAMLDGTTGAARAQSIDALTKRQ